MAEIPAGSVTPAPKKKPPTIGAQVTDAFKAALDACRDLFPDPLTPSGRASRSGVIRLLLEQGLPMLDRANVHAVRAIARREGLDDAAAWHRVILRGIAASEKSPREGSPREGNTTPAAQSPAAAPESAPGDEHPPRRVRRRGA